MSELKPCPHCGGDAEYRYGSSTSPYVRCGECGCRTGSSRDLAKLAKAWNARWGRTCRFSLEPEHEAAAEKAKAGAGEFVTCDIQLAWTCSACGQQSTPVHPFPALIKHCPNCGARVEGVSY